MASRGVRGERKSLAQNRHAEQEARVMVAVCRSECSGNHVAEIRVEPLERETSALGVVELDSLLWVLEWILHELLAVEPRPFADVNRNRLGAEFIHHLT